MANLKFKVVLETKNYSKNYTVGLDVIIKFVNDTIDDVKASNKDIENLDLSDFSLSLDELNQIVLFVTFNGEEINAFPAIISFIERLFNKGTFPILSMQILR